MNCQSAREHLDAFADGELDPVMSGKLEGHMAGCAACAADLAAIRALSRTIKTAQRFTAPASLRDKIAADLARAANNPAPTALGTHALASPSPAVLAGSNVTPFGPKAGQRRQRSSPAWGRPLALAASYLLTLGLGGWFALSLAGDRMARQELTHEMMSAHVRSMMDDKLIQVASSDRHTVKPWFAGKLDFSPAVMDLSAEGYPLLGGRIDHLEGRSVAALVYGRRQHKINVMVAPSEPNQTPERGVWSTSEKGFALGGFEAAGARYRVVSDLNAQELGAFMQMLKGELAK